MDAENSLSVLEAYAIDVGRGVARIDKNTMTALGLSIGDVIEIKGKRTTAAKCLPSLTREQLDSENIHLALAREKLCRTQIEEKDQTKSDWSAGTAPRQMSVPDLGKAVRIDGLTRNNAGIAIGDLVTIRKTVSPKAEKMAVVPLEEIPPIDERYLADVLEGMPVTRGDNVMVPYFGGRLTFQVLDVKPNIISIVHHKTIVSISTKGPTMRAVDGPKYYSCVNMISFRLEHVVRKENLQDDYLILKVHLQYGGFGRIGEFQIKLEKGAPIQQLVTKYWELAEEVVKATDTSMEQTGKIYSADLISDLEFKILERWRAA